MTEKVCFVAMGFGEKMDYQNSQKVDLDRIYNKIIKPLFDEELQEYKLIRADEISGSSMIDVAMYNLLLNADLVIADVTTLNPNAIYELGVRHALRQFSTIIMAQSDNKLPFDLDHSRYLKYEAIGEKLDENEANTIREKLKEFVRASESQQIDSPFYTFLPDIQPPTICEKEYKKIIKKAEDSDETITKLVKEAKDFMKQSDFKKAVTKWKKLKKALPNNEYVVQQLALSLYKSKFPNETKALDLAKETIQDLRPEKSLDLETLGITGAIYKNLYRLNDNFDYLDEAVSYYKKGFVIKQDYYTGENYANCLLLKTKKTENDPELLAYLRYEIKKVYLEIISIVQTSLDDDEENYWMYATLATAYLYLDNQENHDKYQSLFYDNLQADWEKKTYQETIEDIKSIKE